MDTVSLVVVIVLSSLLAGAIATTIIYVVRGVQNEGGQSKYDALLKDLKEKGGIGFTAQAIKGGCDPNASDGKCDSQCSDRYGAMGVYRGDLHACTSGACPGIANKDSPSCKYERFNTPQFCTKCCVGITDASDPMCQVGAIGTNCKQCSAGRQDLE